MNDDPYDSLAAHLVPEEPQSWKRLKMYPGLQKPPVAACGHCGAHWWRREGNWVVCLECERKGQKMQRYSPEFNV